MRSRFPARFSVTFSAALAIGLTHALAGQGKAPPPVTPAPPIHTVTAATATVDQAAYSGKCPVKLTFTGTINTGTFTGKRIITYEWVRSDKSVSPKKTVEMTGGTSANVTITWTLGTAGQKKTVSEVLKVLSPTGISSQPAQASINCTP